MQLRTRILEATVDFRRQRLAKPLVLSSGAIVGLIEACACVRVETPSGVAQGRGSVYLSDLWAWPNPAIAHDRREMILRSLCETIGAALTSLTGGEPHHPLELGLRLHDSLAALNNERFAVVPSLARVMCASPFDAAIHDAVGYGTGRNAFAFYDDPCAIPSAEKLFARDGASAAIKRMLRHSPTRTLPAWYVIGKNDDLECDVRPAVDARGYRCFKLKLMGGRDAADDVARTVEVFRALKEWGVKQLRLTVDSNEANPDVQSVLDFLCELRARDPGAFDALQYLEQPTSRDIHAHCFDWRPVAALKPVLLDEGLSSLELLSAALQQGWSGLAIKTCKGHSFSVVAAAWAHQQGMFLSLQDLTNPGYALIHAALMGAHLPTINGAELNSPQFTPAANAPWLPRMHALFEPRDGVHELPAVAPVGLGSLL